MKKFKVKILVSPKENIKNPQGETLSKLLQNLELEVAANATVGKYYTLELCADNEELVTEKANKISTEILSNPLVEDFEIAEIKELVENE